MRYRISLRTSTQLDLENLPRVLPANLTFAGIVRVLKVTVGS